jgi:hypothetical protein
MSSLKQQNKTKQNDANQRGAFLVDFVDIGNRSSGPRIDKYGSTVPKSTTHMNPLAEKSNDKN